MGGFKGWLIKLLVKEFSKEVIETVEVYIDYIEIKKKVQGSVTNENRNEATDNLNSTMRS